MRLISSLMLVVVLCALSMSASAGQVVPGVPLTLTSTQREAVARDVRGNLKDPDSAKFGSFYASTRRLGDGSNFVTVCGFVNAKNSYGGYAGMRPFVGALLPNGTFVLSSLAGDEAEQAATARVCRDAGIALP